MAKAEEVTADDDFNSAPKQRSLPKKNANSRSRKRGKDKSESGLTIPATTGIVGLVLIIGVGWYFSRSFSSPPKPTLNQPAPQPPSPIATSPAVPSTSNSAFTTAEAMPSIAPTLPKESLPAISDPTSQKNPPLVATTPDSSTTQQPSPTPEPVMVTVETSKSAYKSRQLDPPSKIGWHGPLVAIEITEGVFNGMELAARAGYLLQEVNGVEGSILFPMVLMKFPAGDQVIACSMAQFTEKSLRPTGELVLADDGGPLDQSHRAQLAMLQRNNSIDRYDVDGESVQGATSVAILFNNRFLPVANSAREIKRIAGHIDFLTCAATEDISIEVRDSVTGKIAPSLAAKSSGITFEPLTKNDQGTSQTNESIAFKIKPDTAIIQGAALDIQNKKPINAFMMSEFDPVGSEGRFTVFGGKMPKKMTVQLRLGTGLKTHRVHFAFENLPLPKNRSPDRVP